MSISVFSIVSELHDPRAVEAVTREALSALSVEYKFMGDDFNSYGSHDLDIIMVCTGGTEGIFKRMLPMLREKSQKPFYLLASNKSNALPASMEILSFLREFGLEGEILHGQPSYISLRINQLLRVQKAVRRLQKSRLAVIGQPSDWLIASHADYALVREKLGVELMDIPMSELIALINAQPTETPSLTVDNPSVQSALPGAQRIYTALKTLLEKYQLDGFTLRCFDLLDAVHNTGCLALAKLNAEGYVAGCEGDVPTMLTMMVARALFGCSGFQANPASVNVETGEILFAHCTIPLDMVQRYELDTHYESGIGVGIRGYMQEGPVTVFKLSGDLSRFFVAEGELIRNQSEPDLCRTQQVVRLSHIEDAQYFLKEPIGNHHVVVLGHLASEIAEVMRGVIQPARLHS